MQQTIQPSHAEHGLTLPDGLPRDGDPVTLVGYLQRLRPRWQLGGMGPRAYFCWSMMQLAEFALFGRMVLPVEAVAQPGAEAGAIRAAFNGSRPARRQWQKRRPGEAPQHGDGVLMSHLDQPWHIGVMLQVDRGIVLHLPDHSDLCIDAPAVLRAKGYSGISYYRWAG